VTVLGSEIHGAVSGNVHGEFLSLSVIIDVSICNLSIYGKRRYFLHVENRTDILARPYMEKNNPKRKRPGRPRRGNVKVTFKLSPDVLKILQVTRRTLNRGKSELVEEALRQYLHMPHNHVVSESRAQKRLAIRGRAKK
jgi:hypothetical protein